MSELHDTTRASGRVVVVEDDPLQAEALAFILRQEGYMVDLAATGRDGRVIDLSAREFDILKLLAEAVGRVVERQQLFASVWGPGFYGDERALDVYIRMIRKKIEPDPGRPRYLHTVRGVGYRLAEEP